MTERHMGGRRSDDESARDRRAHWADRDDTVGGASSPGDRPARHEHAGYDAYPEYPQRHQAPRHTDGYPPEPPAGRYDDRYDARYDAGSGYDEPRYRDEAPAPRHDDYGHGHAGYDDRDAGYGRGGYADDRYADERYVEEPLRHADRGAYHDRGRSDDRSYVAAVPAGHQAGYDDAGYGDRYDDGYGGSYIDTPVDEGREPVVAGKWSRRKIVGTLLGTGLAAAACSKVATSDKVRQAVQPFVNDMSGPASPTTAPSTAPPKSFDTSDSYLSKRAAGGRASKSRTYSSQNDSYMGGKAGKQLKKNTPTVTTLYSGPAAAAAATKVTLTTVLAKDPIRHLASRTTFGATPTVVADIRKTGIDAWLSKQLQPTAIPETAGEQMTQRFETSGKSIAQLREMKDRDEKSKRENRPYADHESILTSIARQTWSDRQLLEVMVDFWTDFLHVASNYDGGEVVRADFENNVIRKYALGNYADMLWAANKHPALLRYLNQDQSTKDNLNENLGRENLELYSVGVDGGYTETDVRQAAMLQSGMRIKDDEFFYDEGAHYVGPIKVMGFSDPNASKNGLAVTERYIRYIALHPSTARYVGNELARHFVSDVPSKSLVDKLAASYTKNKGSIVPVLVTLFSSSDFWASVGQKVRRPGESLVATYRALAVQPGAQQDFKQGLDGLYNKMRELGQFPGGQQTPNGYPDVFVAWTSAGGMINNWNEGLDAIYGGRKEFRYVKPEQLVTNPPTTAGAYVDALSRRLVNQTLLPKDRTAVLAVAGVPATAKVDASFNGAVGAVARAILASPLHSLK